MNLSKLKLIEKVLKEEKQQNDDKIKKLNNSLKFLQSNSIGNKLLLVLGFSIIPWGLFEVLICLCSFNGIFISVPLLSGLSVIVPALLVYCVEKIFEKRCDLKNRLQKFNVNNQKDIMNKLIKYDIEKEQYLCKNKVLDNVLNEVSERKNILIGMFDKYNFVYVEDANVSLSNIKNNNVDNIDKMLKENGKKLDNLIVRNVLKDKYDSNNYKLEIIKNSVFGGLFSMITLCFPIILVLALNANAYSSINVSELEVFVGILSSYLIGSGSVFLYNLKEVRDNNQILDKISMELTGNSISNIKNNDKGLGYTKEINTVLSQMSLLRFDLEKAKVNLEVSKINDEVDKDKINFSYQYEPNRVDKCIDNLLYQSLEVKKENKSLIRKK